jgi:hypothetical protein
LYVNLSSQLVKPKVRSVKAGGTEVLAFWGKRCRKLPKSPASLARRFLGEPYWDNLLKISLMAWLVTANKLPENRHAKKLKHPVTEVDVFLSILMNFW